MLEEVADFIEGGTCKGLNTPSPIICFERWRMKLRKLLSVSS